MVIDKKVSEKIENFCFTSYIFGNSFCFFCVYDFITHDHWIMHTTCQIFSIFTTTCTRIPSIIFFRYTTFFILTSTFTDVPPLIWITFFSSNLHVHSHDISFVKMFDSFFPGIILKTCIFKIFCFIWTTYFIR